MIRSISRSDDATADIIGLFLTASLLPPLQVTEAPHPSTSLGGYDGKGGGGRRERRDERRCENELDETTTLGGGGGGDGEETRTRSTHTPNYTHSLTRTSPVILRVLEDATTAERVHASHERRRHDERPVAQVAFEARIHNFDGRRLGGGHVLPPPPPSPPVVDGRRRR